MDFLSSPPDVPLDWNAMLMRLDHDHSDFSHSPNSSVSPFFDDAQMISVHEPNRFERARPTRHQPPAGVGVSQNATAMREMVFRMAAMQPVHVIDPESVRPPKRRNVRISKDPQSAAARRRRERISERMRILQRLVPGGTKMDTASMLDEAVQYLKFLKGQVRMMERAGFGRGTGGGGGGIVTAGFPSGSLSSCSGKIEPVFDYEFVNNPMHLLS